MKYLIILLLASMLSSCGSSSNTASNGICGTANGKTYSHTDTNYGADTQCTQGKPSTTTFPEEGQTVSWMCSGTNGGNTSLACSVNRTTTPIVDPEPIDGVCGTANGKTYGHTDTNYGSDTQCSQGEPSSTTFPTQGQTASWTCFGSSGGNNDSCSVSRNTTPVIDPEPIDGACGTANGKTYSYTDTSYGTDTQCSQGEPSSTAFPAEGQTASWVCSGTHGGDNASCSVSRATTPIVDPDPIDGTCGTANGKTYSHTDTNYGTDTQCSQGEPSSNTFPAEGQTASWICSGSNGGDNASCSVNRNTTPIVDPEPVDGQCGTANGKTYSYTDTNYGSDTQCSQGEPSSTTFPTEGQTENWVCPGTDGGSNDSCSAERSSVPEAPWTLSQEKPDLISDETSQFLDSLYEEGNSSYFFLPKENIESIKTNSNYETIDLQGNISNYQIISKDIFEGITIIDGASLENTKSMLNITKLNRLLEIDFTADGNRFLIKSITEDGIKYHGVIKEVNPDTFIDKEIEAPSIINRD